MLSPTYSYTIKVLQCVSFDTELFCKELRKALHYLLPHEKLELKRWMKRMVFLNPHLERGLGYLH